MRDGKGFVEVGVNSWRSCRSVSLVDMGLQEEGSMISGGSENGARWEGGGEGDSGGGKGGHERIWMSCGYQVFYAVNWSENGRW